MFDFFPAVFLVMQGRALYRRRSLFDPRLVVILVKVFVTICNSETFILQRTILLLHRILEVSLTRTPI